MVLIKFMERGEIMLKKIASIVALFGLAVIPLASNAADLGSLTVSPTTVRPGGTVNVSGSFGTNNANASVRFTMDTGTTTVDIQPQNTVTTNASGNFSTTLTVPSDFATGTATLTATSNNDTLDRELTISSTVTTTPTGGVSAGNGGLVERNSQLVLAGLAVLTGAALILAARRKADQTGNA